MSEFVPIKLAKYSDETALIDLEQVVAVGPPTAMYDIPQPMPQGERLPNGDPADTFDSFDIDDYYVTNIYLSSGHVLQLQGRAARERLVLLLPPWPLETAPEPRLPKRSDPWATTPTPTPNPPSGVAVFSSCTVLPDGTLWVPGTDMARFTDPNHPNYWVPPEVPNHD